MTQELGRPSTATENDQSSADPRTSLRYSGRLKATGPAISPSTARDTGISTSTGLTRSNDLRRYYQATVGTEKIWYGSYRETKMQAREKKKRWRTSRDETGNYAQMPQKLQRKNDNKHFKNLG